MFKKPLKDYRYKPSPIYDISLLDEFPDLLNWLTEISRYNRLENFLYICDYNKKEKRITVRIYTKEHYYTISARLPRTIREHIIQTDGLGNVVGESNAPIDDGYLGTTGSVRKPRAGEWQNRGSDLPDGPYNKATWDQFKNKFISYELVKVVKTAPDQGEKERRKRLIN